jgi:Flp pilus assembly protein TadD, contains TPR repeats
MKKLILISLILGLAGCSTFSRSGEGGESSGDSATASNYDSNYSDPQIDMDEPGAPASSRNSEAPRPIAPPSANQSSALNEAVKTQNDERIYHASTQILATSPNDIKALNALAMYHFRKGRPELARYLLNKGIAANSRVPALYSNLGIVQLSQDENREAIKSFRKALDVDSSDAIAAANVGSLYIAEKDYNKAAVALETAYRKGVRDPKLLNNYGIALTAQGKYDKAREVYDQALKENSSNKEALFNLAVLLVDHMEKYSDAMEVINRLKFVGGPADSRSQINALENKAKAGLK